MVRRRFLFASLFALGVVALSVAGPVAFAAAPKPVAGKVTHVTLYRGQAMVTRTVTVEGGKGGVDIVVGDLPEQVMPDSLFAEGGEGIIVRAVRFRSRAVGDEPREEVRKIDATILELRDKITTNQKNLELLVKKTAYLDQLEGFVAPTAKTELSKGVLNAESLEKITSFSFEQRKAIAAEQVALGKEARELGEQLSFAERRRAEIATGASKTVREAVLFLDKQTETPENVRLNYLVNQAGWSPTYTFRADKDRTKVNVEYNALIQQMSGEDWQDVALTLSTASPSLSAAGPGLAPFNVTLTDGSKTAPMAQTELAQQLQQVRTRQTAANYDNRNAVSIMSSNTSSWAINAAANDFQCLVLTNSLDVLASVEGGMTGDTEGPNLSYSLASSVSLASRSDQQMVRILQTPLKSQFYYTTTPLLTSYVYREADVTNGSNEDLLAGPINVYLDGRFVGRSEIPTVARGQSFVVGFGADPQLRAKHELAEKKDDVQGGNRELEFKYRLVIENFKNEAAQVRVHDRLPFSDNSTDVNVTMTEGKDPISADKVYLRRERPQGLLRWDIEVPKSATGENARMVEYTVRVEFDRKFQLTAAGKPAEQQMKEFEKLQRGRLKR